MPMITDPWMQDLCTPPRPPQEDNKKTDGVKMPKPYSVSLDDVTDLPSGHAAMMPKMAWKGPAPKVTHTEFWHVEGVEGRFETRLDAARCAVEVALMRWGVPGEVARLILERHDVVREMLFDLHHEELAAEIGAQKAAHGDAARKYRDELLQDYPPDDLRAGLGAAAQKYREELAPRPGRLLK